MPRLELRIPSVKERRGKNPFTGEPLVIPGRSAATHFFEVEQRGTLVVTAVGAPDQPTRNRETTYPTEDEAYAAMAKAIVAKRRRGYVEVSDATEPVGSQVLLDVYFSASDPRFLSELLRSRGVKRLAGLAAHWYEDKRPFAREMLFAYVEDGCMRPEHQALVKRLYKQAEAAKDDELLARFLVSFDRGSRRCLQTVGYYWDSTARQSVRELGLREDPRVPEAVAKGKPIAEFSRSTRRYLARRVFRYFRRLGYRDPAAYRRAMVLALARYREEHLNTVGKLVSAWGLLHVLYGQSKLLERRPRGIRLAAGATLGELTPAPLFPHVWTEGFEDLLRLCTEASSRTVRAWAVKLLEQSHQAALDALPLEQVKQLLLANSEEAQGLGVGLFGKQTSLSGLSLDDWLELLTIENLDVLAVVCERATQYLEPSRLALETCVRWVQTPAAPLAAMALEFCRTKPVDSAVALTSLLRTCQARVPSVRGLAAAYCGEVLTQSSYATLPMVRELCDSMHPEVRVNGLAAAVARWGKDAELWSALCESPYPDVRRHVLERASAFRDSHPDSLPHLLGTVLLSLQGAAKDKRRCAVELVARIGASPDGHGPVLLPLLKTLLGSIHPAERGLALGTLARLAVASPPLRERVHGTFPDLAIASGVSQ